jgi:hypothetical protein
MDFVRRQLVSKYGHKIDPALLDELLRDTAEALQGISSAPPAKPPFNVPWMDSWVAHWTYQAEIKAAEQRTPEMAVLLRSLADLKFNERLDELSRFARDLMRVDEPPDGGPPEPGTPPAGPRSFFEAPPDGGPPEPGTPPAGPARMFDEPPDGGTPEPGVPPTGPDASFLHDNPWVLYWFVSLKAPTLLAVIDAHFTRRLRDLATQQRQY